MPTLLPVLQLTGLAAIVHQKATRARNKLDPGVAFGSTAVGAFAHVAGSAAGDFVNVISCINGGCNSLEKGDDFGTPMVLGNIE